MFLALKKNVAMVIIELFFWIIKFIFTAIIGPFHSIYILLTDKSPRAKKQALSGLVFSIIILFGTFHLIKGNIFTGLSIILGTMVFGAFFTDKNGNPKF
ncbi:MAG: hypothetical protein KTR26_16970 [Flammeovirgaceae bacterium]|nr:hypothetical protein [Flammeovirgaceae bacterium]